MCHAATIRFCGLRCVDVIFTNLQFCGLKYKCSKMLWDPHGNHEGHEIKHYTVTKWPPYGCCMATVWPPLFFSSFFVAATTGSYRAYWSGGNHEVTWSHHTVTIWPPYCSRHMVTLIWEHAVRLRSKALQYLRKKKFNSMRRRHYSVYIGLYFMNI